MSLSEAAVATRSKRIRQAVEDGLERWQADGQDMAIRFWDGDDQQQFEARLNDPRPSQNGRDPSEPVIQSIPRRERLIAPSENDVTTPIFVPAEFETSFFRAVLRLVTWIVLIFQVLLGNSWDKIRKRDSVERRAVRLREGLERVGGTFVKLGQQVAMRIDLIPWEYSIELSKMLDKMQPFSLEQALEAIEETIGKPWQEVFAVFDPEPVGSASVACVYQAVLKNGEKVAVKVRRPGIGEIFMADFRVLDWLAEFIEFLTIVRPGFTTHLRAELRETLLEELDFRKEARFQDIFRRGARKTSKNYFSAPKVYFELSGEKVIVEEFVSGVWLWEIVGALEQNDRHMLNMMKKLDIDPKIVARRILWATFWSMDDNLFFHADPHPANILVRPGNKITFIDFGSCGSFNEEQKAILERVVLARMDRDPEAMARGTLQLMEPFPPIDVNMLMREAQAEYTQLLYTLETKSKYTEWWERSSARQWLLLVKVAREFNIPLNLSMLRMIRATLLYDTLVLRLDPTIDRYSQYAKYMDQRAKLVRRRWQKRVRQNLGDSAFLRIEELAETADALLTRAQRLAGSPVFSFNSVVDKWTFVASVLGRLAGRLVIITVIAALLVSFSRYLQGEALGVGDIWSEVFSNTLYHIVVLAAIVLNGRLILFRLRDTDE